MSSPSNNRRRHFLTLAVLGTAGAIGLSGCASDDTAKSTTSSTPPAPPPKPRYALNTATISGYKLPFAEQLEVTARAGYDAIEPWLGDLHAAKKNGTFRDLAKRRADLGLAVAGAIAFPAWIVNDAATRAKALEQLRRDMDLLAEFGGSLIATPPAGAYDPPVLELPRIAERYHAVLALRDKTGVTPMLEFWGGSANLNTLEKVAEVVRLAGAPAGNAAVLADIFHMYKGGSDFAFLAKLRADQFRTIHLNDYPAKPLREKIGDGDRVWPTDGVAPWKTITGALAATGANPFYSLELFNPKYWRTTALDTARTGLAKMRAIHA